MNNSVVFNDASLPFPVDTEPYDEIFDFFKSLNVLSKAQISIVNKDEVTSNWADLDYAEGFNFGIWINNHLDRDEKLFVSNIMSKVDCPFSEGAQKFLKSRIFVLASDDTIDVDAFGYASHLGVPAVSFASNQIWLQYQCCIVEHYSEDASAKKTVENIGTSERALEWSKFVLTERQNTSGFLKSLLQEGNHDFPNLLFCDEVLKGWQRPGAWWSHQGEIIDALTSLNLHIATSANLAELIDNSGLNISDESLSTSTNPKFRRRRMFKHPALGKSYFGLHVKNFRDAKRLYFLPDFNRKKVCIGYFGNHLATTSNP